MAEAKPKPCTRPKQKLISQRCDGASLGDPDDGQRDGGLDDAAGHRDHAQNGEGQRDAVGDREGRDDLEEGKHAAAPQQQHEEERQVVVASEDMLDAELEEARLRATGPARAHRDSGHARIGSEGQLPRLAVGLDLRQRVVVDSEDVEDIVLHDEIPHPAPTREVEMHRETGGVEGRRYQLARTRLAANAAGPKHDLPAQQVEELVPALRAALLRDPERFRQVRGECGRGQGQRVANGAPTHGNRGIAGGAANMGRRRRHGNGEEKKPQADQAER